MTPGRVPGVQHRQEHGVQGDDQQAWVQQEHVGVADEGGGLDG